ncbi:MAG: HEPN domain-containing protein [Candidatus Rokubacteria bacterium]|nr:HEPN domain-containing protein [Candidatus Rokubacteria bacterium]
MLTTLTAVVERLVSHYDPDRIILFGSHATGGAEVERLLADRAVPLDVLVYTRREMRDLYALGSPFIEEVVEHGRVLYMRRATEAWLREAEEELESAAILLEREKHRAACLHGQQCVERALKALLLGRGQGPPRSHDVVELYRGRYPTEEGLLPHGETTAEDARRAVGAAEAALRDVRASCKPGLRSFVREEPHGVIPAPEDLLLLLCVRCGSR